MKLLVVSGFLGSVVAQLQSCVEDFDDTVNYFAGFEDIDLNVFSVRYENSYKVVNNRVDATEYVLYLCGTPPPDNEIGQLVQVPVADFGVTSQTLLPRLQSIEEIGKMNLDLTGVTLPACFEPASNLVSSAVCLSGPDTADCDATSLWSSMEDPAQVVFCQSPCTMTPPTPTESKTFNTVLATDYLSTTIEDKNSWVIYLSLFFNKEELSTVVSSAVLEDVDCLGDELSILEELVTDVGESRDQKNEKNVLIISSYWEGEFNIVSCPNYYCEYVDTVSDRTGIDFNIITRETLNVPTGNLNATDYVQAIAAAGITVDVLVFQSYLVSPFVGFEGPGENGAFDALVTGLGISEENVFYIPDTNPWFALESSVPQLAQSDYVVMLSPESTTQPLRFFQRLDDDAEYTSTIADIFETCTEFTVDVCTFRQIGSGHNLKYIEGIAAVFTIVAMVVM